VKRTLICFSLLIVLILILSGCSAPEDTSPNVKITGGITRNTGGVSIMLLTYPDNHFVSDAMVTVNGIEIPSIGNMYFNSIGAVPTGTTVVFNINSPTMGVFSGSGIMPVSGGSLLLYNKDISGCTRCSADTYISLVAN
jgi:hypothetical protein